MEAKPFDTSDMFVGGKGLFIQYHDIIKPVYLYAICKMIIQNISFGLPIRMIKDMSVYSTIEWYMQRKYRNPLQCLDYQNKADTTQVDILLKKLLSDPSLYSLSPLLNTARLLSVYVKQHMNIPVFLYNEYPDENMEKDIIHTFPDIHFQFLYGDIASCVKSCDENFTYILSDIHLLKNLSELLLGTYSHVLLAEDYRYNYEGRKFIYDLLDIQRHTPFLRIGTIQAVDINVLLASFGRILE